MRRWVGAAALIVASSSAEAEPMTIAGEALRELVAGKTVNLDTPYGNLPITFKADGTMSGKAGVLALYLGSTTDRGRWSIKGDRICQKFFKWFDGDTNCLTVRQDGRKITWRRDDGLSGTATIAANDAVPPPPPSGLGLPPSVERETPAAAAASPEKRSPAVHSPAARAEVETDAEAPAVAAAVVRLPDPPHADKVPERPIPPRMALASLHPAPSAPRLQHPLTRSHPADGGRESGERSGPSGPVATPRQAVEQMLKARLEHQWCMSPAVVPGAAIPALMAVAQGRLDTGASTEMTGCLMALPLLPEIARLAVPETLR